MHSEYPRQPRLLQLFKQISQWRNPRAAWHHSFHRDAERWSMTQFKDANSSCYLSLHTITCERCAVSHRVHHSWPKFNADRNQGYLLAEAHSRASRYAGQC